jgi:hypothetical protein
MRTGLIAAIQTATSTLTQFTVSQELPWLQNAQPLYLKNMKKIYVGATEQEQSVLFMTLDDVDVDQNLFTTRDYVSVDAKNPPSQLDQLITNILTCKSQTGVVSFDEESDYTVEQDEDRLIYTFEFRLTVATT